jgi:hypothetical protein
VRRKIKMNSRLYAQGPFVGALREEPSLSSIDADNVSDARLRRKTPRIKEPKATDIQPFGMSLMI